MEITVRFPNLRFLFEYEDRTFSVLGFDITIYGILMAVSLLIGLGDDSSLRQMAEIESESLPGSVNLGTGRWSDRRQALLHCFFMESVQW